MIKGKLYTFHTLLIAMLLVCLSSNTAQSWTTAQIKQIEDIARAIAEQHNSNSKALLDDKLVSTRAVAVSRNVIFEYVLRVKRDNSPAILREFSTELRHEMLPKVCQANSNNAAFYRGLYYTFRYRNTYGEKLADFDIIKDDCRPYWKK